MSPKELLYIEDALGHEQFCINQCNEALQTLQDPQLKQCTQNILSKHQQLYGSLYQLV